MGLAKIIVIGAVKPRRDDVARHQLADALFADRAAARLRMPGNSFITGEGFSLLIVIHQHQGMAVFIVAEQIANTFQLQQTADEMEAAFRILHHNNPTAGSYA